MLKSKRPGRSAIRYLLPQLSLLLITTTACAQTIEVNHSPDEQDSFSKHSGSAIGLSAGYNHITTRNDAVSPLLSAGSSALFSLKYYNERPKYFQSIKIDYAKTVGVSSVNNPSDIRYGSISYQYYRKVAQWKKNKYQFNAGGGITTYAIDRDFRPKFAGYERTIMISATAGPTASVHYALSERDRLTVSCQIALLGYTVKSGYAQTAPDQQSGEDNFVNLLKSGDLLPIGKLLVAEASLSYQRDISKRFVFGIYSDINYLKITDYNSFAFANNPLMFSLLYKLSK